MSVLDVFKKIGGFLGEIIPTVGKLGEALNLILALVSVGVAERDVEKVRSAAQKGMELGELFSQLGIEVSQFFAELLAAVADDSDKGRDISGTEIKVLMQQADDIPPIAAEIGQKAAGLVSDIRSLF